MHAFTRPSHQLRLKVRDALLGSLHHTFLYRHLIIANKAKGAHINIIGHAAIQKRIASNPKEGNTLLKLLYGQLAQRYGHAPTNACPLYHKPDSCTPIAGKCPDHEALRINRLTTV